jgi:site-specific recombinase XerD
MEAVVLPAYLDGSTGLNRADTKRPQTAANNDYQAISAWLAIVDNKNTYDSYRREAERLYWWAVYQRGLPVSSLRHEDFVVYREFLRDPQPTERWIAKKKHPREHPHWRLFNAPLRPSSVKQALKIINGMLTWLVNAGYLAGNPLALQRRHGGERDHTTVTRVIEDDLWQEIKLYIEVMPRETPRQHEEQVRARWIFSLLYIGGLRISELTNNSMGGIWMRRAKNGEDVWLFKITGKGEKEREVTITPEMRVELARYRRERGLGPIPLSGETTPLVMRLQRAHKPLTRAGMHSVVKRILAGAADMLAARGGTDIVRAERLRQVSAHWLRHTAATTMLERGISLVMTRDALGHSNIATTNQYVHANDDQRHIEVGEKQKIGWD